MEKGFLQFSCMKEVRGTEINHGPPCLAALSFKAQCNNSSSRYAIRVMPGTVFRNSGSSMQAIWHTFGVPPVFANPAQCLHYGHVTIEFGFQHLLEFRLFFL